MNQQQETKITLEEFWKLHSTETNLEFVDGRAIAKVSPKFFHSSIQFALLRLLYNESVESGRVLPEWAVSLERNGAPWVPTPDITYVAFEHLPKNWSDNAACPVPCDVAFEIVSPGQGLHDFLLKAKDYLDAGVSEVWVIDPDHFEVLVFEQGKSAKTYSGDEQIKCRFFPKTTLSASAIFEAAGIQQNIK